jgi:hypothetical protein
MMPAKKSESERRTVNAVLSERPKVKVQPTAGYSGTPLAKKLGVKDGQRTWRAKMPDRVAAEIADLGVAPVLMKAPAAGLEMAHIFVTQRGELAAHLQTLRRLLAQDGVIWVSWPKKTVPKGVTAIPSDVTEDTVREICLPLGLVDVKVCAVDVVWSGLKLVIRKSERG